MRKIVAVDTETYLTRAGVPAPKIVCLSFAAEDEVPGLVLREEGVALMHNFLDDDWEITGQNFRYDVGCLCVEDWELFPKFIQAYEEGRIHDIGIRDTLYNLGTQGLFSEEDGEQKARQLLFSLGEIVKRRFRVDLSEDKAKTKVKINADGSENVTLTGSATAWRLRYSELDGVPLDQWPPDAKRYAQDDAVWTMKTHKDQDAGPSIVNADMQTLSAFWLYLMGLYGVRTDPEYVARLATKLQKEFRIQNAILMEAGLLNEKKNPKKDWETKGQWGLARNMRQLRRRVAQAYGGETALIKLEAIYRAQDMRTEAKKEAAKQLARARAAAKKADKVRQKLLDAGMTPEEVVSTEPVLETTPEQDAEQDAEGGEDSGTVKVVDGVPMTEKGQIATDRDTLQKLAHPKAVEAVKEAYLADVPDDSTIKVPSIRPYVEAVAGIFQLEPEAFYNELVLHETGERSEVEKLLSTFVPVLMQGTQVPVNPRWNPLVATGRTSCSRPNLQQLPRKGGVRECFIPRPGYWYGAADYSSVELCTLGQVCIDIFGFSRLADAINAGMDPHLMFAANLMGISYEEIAARHAAGDEIVAEMRQAAKAANFGYPGGLGAESFREYARATYGVVMTPERAIELRAIFYATWPEIKKYHKYIGDMSNQSHHFKIKQHRSNRVRAGCTFTSGANCVDYETEALTQRGWVRGPDIKLSDKLLTKNPKSGSLEWQHPTRINLYPKYSGPLLEFSSTRFSAVTTPEHRWLVSENKSNKDKCVVSSKLSRHGDHRIHRTGVLEAPEGPYTDDFLELVGWLLTDGNISKEVGSTRITLYQTKPKNVERIDALFERMGLPASKYKKDDSGAFVWHLSGKPRGKTLKLSVSVQGATRGSGCAPKGYVLDDYLRAGMGVEPDISVAATLGVSLPAVRSMRSKNGIERPRPDGKGVTTQIRSLFPDRLLTSSFVYTLSRRQAQHLMSVMLLGDGTRGESGTEKFFTKSEASVDAVQMLLVLAGQASSAVWRDMSMYEQKQYPSMKNIPKLTGIWNVNLYKRDKVQLQEHQVREFTEARGVWCPTVPNGYFVARRKKTVYITGNSLFQGLAADGAKLAGWMLLRECYLERPYEIKRPERLLLPVRAAVEVLRIEGTSPLYGSRPIGFIHDEFLSELPIATASEALERKAVIMSRAMEIYTPDVRSKTEAALMRRWLKGAKPVRDENGRLIPWEPKAKK